MQRIKVYPGGLVEINGMPFLEMYEPPSKCDVCGGLDLVLLEWDMLIGDVAICSDCLRDLADRADRWAAIDAPAPREEATDE